MAAVMEEKAILGLREVALLVFSAFALFMLISLMTFSNEDPGWSHSGSVQGIGNSCGVVGAWLSDFILSLFGLMGYLFPLMMAWIGYLVYREQLHTENTVITAMRWLGFIFTIAFGSALLYLYIMRVDIELPGGSGGVLGQEIADLAISLLGNSGANITLFLGLLIGITLFTDLSWLYLIDSIGKYTIELCLFIWRPLDTLERILPKRSRLDSHFSQYQHSKPAETAIDTMPQRKASVSIDRQEEGTGATQSGTNNKVNIIRSSEPTFGYDPLFDQTEAVQRTAPVFKSTAPVELSEEVEDFSPQTYAEAHWNKPESFKPQVQQQPVYDFYDNSAAFAPINTVDQPFLPPNDERFEDSPNESVAVNFVTYDDPVINNDVDFLDNDTLNFEDEYASLEANLNHEKIRVHQHQYVEPNVPFIAHVDREPKANPGAFNAYKAQEPELKLRVTDYRPQHAAPSSAAMQHLKDTGDVLPSLSLLDKRDTRVKGYTDAELEDMSRMVEDVLQDFNVVVEVVAVHPGPVITRFELQPAAGVKVSRISGLAKDLARALSVTSVRIVEIIPGKSVIGMEIPNQEREIVTLRDLLISSQFNEAKSNLTLAMGKDISGQPVVADLGKMPHALVAGTTGSGKSVAINTMILSLLYKATPEQVRLIMIDPKMLELSVYEGIPHLLTPVVTDMKEAQNALRWAVGEMERRYKLMSKMGVRNLAGFNQLIEDAAAKGEAIRDPLFQYDKPLGEHQEFPVLSTLPSIVIVIDELADMMMIVGKKVEELIARLAQKARAAGIHLILATQRPSVDVLTGLIKANVPTRISFQVSSRIDSRTILDQGGAEALLGNGDMLFLPSGTSIPIRAHGAFVDDHEVHRVVEFLKQTAPPNYLEEITREVTETIDGYGNAIDDAEGDALYDQAVQFVTETRKASISSVQRRFKVGYNRAARMIEDMEAAGVVSSPESNGFREVLAPAPPRRD